MTETIFIVAELKGRIHLLINKIKLIRSEAATTNYDTRMRITSKLLDEIVIELELLEK